MSWEELDAPNLLLNHADTVIQSRAYDLMWGTVDAGDFFKVDGHVYRLIAKMDTTMGKFYIVTYMDDEGEAYRVWRVIKGRTGTLCLPYVDVDKCEVPSISAAYGLIKTRWEGYLTGFDVPDLDHQAEAALRYAERGG